MCAMAPSSVPFDVHFLTVFRFHGAEIDLISVGMFLRNAGCFIIQMNVDCKEKANKMLTFRTLEPAGACIYVYACDDQASTNRLGKFDLMQRRRRLQPG